MRRANSEIEKCGVPSETALKGAPVGNGGERARRLAQVFRREAQAKLRLSPPHGGLKVRGLGGAANGMKQRDRAGGSGGGAQRLQVVLARLPGAGRRSPGTSRPQRRRSHGRPRPRGGCKIPIVRNRGDLDQQPAPCGFGKVQAVGRRAAGHRAAEVDEIAIAVGARADHRIGEDDRVQFAPGDLRRRSAGDRRFDRARR